MSAPPALEREFLSVADIVAIYGVSRSFAYGLKTKITWYRFAGVKFRREDVERFLERDRKVVSHEVGGPQPQGKGRRLPLDLDDNARDDDLRDRYGF